MAYITHTLEGLHARPGRPVPAPLHLKPSRRPRLPQRTLHRTKYRESQVGDVGEQQPAALQAPLAEPAGHIPEETVPERPTSEELLQRAPPPPPSATLKVIGLGARGINSANKLADQADSGLSMAEFWAMDSDKKALSTVSPAVRILEVCPGDDVGLQPAHLATIMGEGHTAPAPGQPDGVAGAVFVLGSAAGSPGGAPLMLQLVNHLRRQGCFVTVALTRPFGFEGARKLEQADALVEAMQDVAHMVVVVDQGVLSRACPGLTMPMASAIADTHIQYVVRSVMWAVRAPELLMMTGGVPLWHGRDLRVMKRPLFPPMMSLLSCPGHAYLGCGQAAVNVDNTTQAVGLADLLTSLAEQATHDALASPFLLNRMPAATAVLCILIFPHNVVEMVHGGGPHEAVAVCRGLTFPAGSASYQDSCEYAVRSAVQRSGEVLQQLVGGGCKDIVVCPKGHDSEEHVYMDAVTFTSTISTPPAPPAPAATSAPTPAQDTGSSPAGPQLRVQCALLVLNVMDDAPADTPAANTNSKSAATARLGLGQQQGAGRRQQPQSPQLQPQPAVLSALSAPSTAAARPPPSSMTPLQPEAPTPSFLLARGGRRSRRTDGEGSAGSGTSTSGSPASPSREAAQERGALRSSSPARVTEPAASAPGHKSARDVQNQAAAVLAAKQSPPSPPAASPWKRPSATTSSTQLASTIAQRLYQTGGAGNDEEQDEELAGGRRQPEIDELVTSIRNRSVSRSPGPWEEEGGAANVRNRTEGMLQKERDF